MNYNEEAKPSYHGITSNTNINFTEFMKSLKVFFHYELLYGLISLI